MSEQGKNWSVALAAAAVYLGFSFVFDAWKYSWLIWVGYAIFRGMQGRKKQNDD